MILPSLTKSAIRTPKKGRIVGLGALLTAAAVAVTLTAAPASAAAPSWGKVVSLPTGADATDGTAQAVPDPAGGSLFYYDLNGVPTVSRVSAAGAVAAATPVPDVPNLGDSGTLGHVALLADGAAVITWNLTSFGPYMAYRAASGTWGKPVSVEGISSFAVQPGTILIAQSDSGGLGVVTRPLSASGAIGAASADTHVYDGNPLYGVSWLALDPKGSAELVVNGEGVPTVSRNAAGVWGTEHDLTASSDVVNIGAASSPAGRAIVGWVEEVGNATSSTGYAATRTPGSAFGTPVSTGEAIGGAGGNTAIVRVAAGTDGTLAEATTLQVYAADSTQTTANSVEIATPSQNALGARHAITGSNDYFTLSSLGAGDSRAIVGDTQVTDGPLKDDGSFTESQFASATTVSASASVAHTFSASSGTYNPSMGKGVPTQAVTAISIDARGNAAAIGQLQAGGPLAYAVEGTKPAAKPKVTVAAKATATASHVSDKISCSAAACKGTLTLKIGRKKAGSASYSLKAGKHATVTLKLTKAGRKAFKHAKTHHVKATATATVKGGTTVTKKVMVS